MNLDGVIRAFNDGAEIKRIWFGNTFVWPDPWTDIWSEGVTVFWERTWRDQWSLPDKQLP